jgi:hypothetical protein
LGNWFSPFSFRQVLAAAMMSLKTISLAVSWERAPLRVCSQTGRAGSVLTGMLL